MSIYYGKIKVSGGQSISSVNSLTDNIYGKVEGQDLYLSSNAINNLSIDGVECNFFNPPNLSTETWTFITDESVSVDYEVIFRNKTIRT